jgi:hypothetical protein
VVLEGGPRDCESGREPTFLSQRNGRLEMTCKLFGAAGELAMVDPGARTLRRSHLVGPTIHVSEELGGRCREGGVLGGQVREPHTTSGARARDSEGSNRASGLAATLVATVRDEPVSR